jgi:hypothetical protein
MSCGSNDTETRNIMRVRGRKADWVCGGGGGGGGGGARNHS